MLPATLADRIIYPGVFDFDARAVHAAFADQAIRANPRTMVLSHEGLAGNVLGRRVEHTIIAERLHAVFGREDTGILMFARNQRDMLISLYKQYLRNGCARTYRELMDPAAIYGLDWSYLQYDRVLTEYRTRFGDDRVAVMFYEDFAADNGACLRNICDWMGLGRGDNEKLLESIAGEGSGERVNSGLVDPLVPVFRVLNKFLMSYMNTGCIPHGASASIARFLAGRRIRRCFRGAGSRFTAAFDAAHGQDVKHYFGPCNRNLAAMLGRALPDGYPA